MMKWRVVVCAVVILAALAQCEEQSASSQPATTERYNYIVGLRVNMTKEEAEVIAKIIEAGIQKEDKEQSGSLQRAFSSSLYKFIIVNNVEEKRLSDLLASNKEDVRYIEKSTFSSKKSDEKEKRDAAPEQAKYPTSIPGVTHHHHGHEAWEHEKPDYMPPGWSLSMLDNDTNDFYYSPYAGWNGNGVNIFVVDSGIEPAHPEFSKEMASSGISRVVIHPNCVFYTPGLGQARTVAPGTDQATAVASVAGGLRTGVAKDVTLHSCKVVDPITQTASSADVVLAFNWILDWKLRQPFGTKVIINLSLGWPTHSATSPEFRAINEAIKANLEEGILTVVNAGSPKSEEHPDRSVDACRWSPCNSGDAICVGGLMRDNNSTFKLWDMGDGKRTGFGSCVDMWAPSANIWVAYYEQTEYTYWRPPVWMYGSASGTALAAPAVSGALAAIWSAYPTASATAVRDFMYQIARTGVIDKYGAYEWPFGGIPAGPDRVLHLLNENEVPAPTDMGTICAVLPDLEHSVVRQFDCSECNGGGCCALYFDDPTAYGSSSRKVVQIMDKENALQPTSASAAFQIWIHPEETMSGTIFTRPSSYTLRLKDGALDLFVQFEDEGTLCVVEDEATETMDYWCHTNVKPHVGQWNHITVSMESGIVRLYLNLQKAWEMAGVGHSEFGYSKSDRSVYIGNNGEGSDPFYGRVSDWRFWQTSLPEDPWAPFFGSNGWAHSSLLGFLPEPSESALDYFLSTRLGVNFRLNECSGPNMQDRSGLLQAVIPAPYWFSVEDGPQYGNAPGIRWVYRHAVDDQDGDGWVYDFDNCHRVANADQQDTNRNNIGDVCDSCPSCCSAQLVNNKADQYLPAFYQTNSSLPINPYFFSVQIHVNPLAPSEANRINSRFDIIKSPGNFELGADYKGELRLGLDVGNLRKWFLSGFIIPSNRWSVIGMTRNGGTFKLFANGQLIREIYPYQTKGASIEANVMLQLGADLPGQIDNFAMWDRPLTEMEMTRSLYPAKRAEDAVSGLIYDFLFDECNDGSTVDVIGGQTATSYGMVESRGREDAIPSAPVTIEWDRFVTIDGSPVLPVEGEPQVRNFVGVDFNFAELVKMQTPDTSLTCGGNGRCHGDKHHS